MSLTQQEKQQIADRINPIFVAVLDEYDFGKYPAAQYVRFKQAFSTLQSTAQDIAEALLWKWGHWAKLNYPQRHRDLINEVQDLWPQFMASNQHHQSKQTFDWWKTQLARNTTFISVAYITHLIHHAEPLPIIDQHNYRAMNALLRSVRPAHRGNKKPSQWGHIIELKDFMTDILPLLGGRGFDEFDRFLMMYGKKCVAR